MDSLHSASSKKNTTIVYGLLLILTSLAYAHFHDRTLKGEFRYPVFISAVNVITTCLTGYICLNFSNSNFDKTQMPYFIIPGLTLAFSGLMTSYALPHLPYQFYVVAKSSKPVAIVLIGFVFLRGRYGAKKLAMSVTITLAVSVYSLYELQKPAEKAASTNFGFGLLCILFGLLMDGVTAAMQVHVNSKIKPTTYQVMFGINLFASIALIGLAIFKDQFKLPAVYIVNNRHIIKDICFMSSLNLGIQLLVYNILTVAGPLTLSIMTTVKKLLVITFISFIRGSHLSTQQWVCAFIVIGAVFYDSYSKEATKSNSKKV